ncbi:FixH family protein [Lichenicoccus roseus]|uniref:FixH family protein n=1 Tax=Lichenicoccus roseus TaxID=2683649 RepID=A0A5R9J0D1_9PROT|nr:FixH family protein [Lichenicoccus roseus]TLU71124.1 FixH family protein [Lichenicoccus roseus]
MTCSRLFASALTLVCVYALNTLPAFAKPDDYRFELVGKPQPQGGRDIVQVRLVHAPDSKPVPDAVIFQTSADMGPMGMPTMTAPVRAVMAAKDGVYGFEVEPGMTGTWAIHLAAKVQGEPETVRGTITADLVT